MFFKKKQEKRSYDKENQKPVIRSSICTGEKAAGFQDIHTGKFTEIMLIRTPATWRSFGASTASTSARFLPNTENRADPKWDLLCALYHGT